MAIYYVDPTNGNDEYDGLTPESAKRSCSELDVRSGDTVLLRRGSVIRGSLKTVEGTEDGVITYGAYGEGELPTVSGSTDVSKAENWECVGDNLWKCTVAIPGEVGNFVFNDGECTATFRWEREELAGQGDFWDNRMSGEHLGTTGTEEPIQEVLLYSIGNPGTVYSHIEAASYHDRILARLRSNMVLENLRFINSGVHGCAGSGKNITVRNCVFENIGGCAWSRDIHVRFGNAVELWHYAEDVLVEGCYFKNVYDSCVTHQGDGARTIPAKYFICRNNIFDTYGMAAFEYRDKLPIDSCFVENQCLNAGCGFAMAGETPPRTSEIWPQPMGHHIFLWRIPQATEGGNLVISHNVFGKAPVGAAIYSIISPEAEAQITLDYNSYEENPVLLNRFGNKNYSDFSEYKAETGKDAHSTCHRTTDE